MCIRDRSGLGRTSLRASAHITGLPDMNKARFDFDFKEIRGTRADLMALLPAGTIPDNIQLPDDFTVRGKFKGDQHNFDADLALITNFGDAYIQGTLTNLQDKRRARYNARFRTEQFDLGRLLKNPEKFGKATVTGHITGTGTDPKTAYADFNINVRSAFFNGYRYHHTFVKGKARNGVIDVETRMDDPNARLNGVATLNLRDRYPAIKAEFNIDSIDLMALKLMDKDFRFHGKITADLPTADPDFLNGDISLTNTLFVTNGKRYQLDTVSLTALSTADSNKLALRSEVINADIIGKYKITYLEPAIQAVLNKYYNTGGKVVTSQIDKNQAFIFTATVSKSPIVVELVPDLEELEDIEIEGEFNFAESVIKLRGQAPYIKYKENEVTGLNFDLDTQHDSLVYSVDLNSLLAGQFQLYNTSVTGSAHDDLILFDLATKDDAGNNKYNIIGTAETEGGNYVIRLDKDGVLLDREKWSVSENNELQFGKSGLLARDFRIYRDNESLELNSQSNVPNSPLIAQLENFKIETITRFATKDTLLVGGAITGQAELKNLMNNPHYTADLVVDDFNFRGDTLGNIDIEANNTTPNTINLSAQVSGRGNDINISGNYYPNAANDKMAFDVHIDNLNLETAEGFSMGNFRDASGKVNGDFTIRGKPSQPVLRGELNFNDVRGNVTKVNNYFTLKNERIRFVDRGISFDQFAIADSTGNNAILDGMIFTENYRDFRFDLTLKSRDFMVMNSARENNNLYYGKLFVDADLFVGGSLNAPSVDGNVGINDKTDLSIIVPQRDPQIQSREGIVEFIDMDDPILNDILTDLRDSLGQSDIKGVDATVNLTVHKDAILNLIIDEGNGDFLRVKGEGNLTAGLDRSGKTTLVGSYEVGEGKYSLTYNFIKREFDIDKNSTILWTGSPLTADVNVNATYVANAAPYDLVKGFLGTASAAVANTYKQKLPFEVKLKMKGELLKPVISFDIDLPRKNYGVSNDIINTVETRLVQLRNEPSELNKQVFAILVLNRFISENPFETSGDAFNAESLARSSVSKLLSEQLNQIAADLISGVDLNFDINSTEDYTTGELKNRTDLNVGLSKRLLDDRLRISVGSTFELEGPQHTNQKTANIAGDVSAEYQLDKAGTYLMRVYRKDEYIIVQGQVVETGLSFIINADYDKLRDIFIRRTEAMRLEKKRLREQERANRANERNVIKKIDTKKPEASEQQN